MVIGPIGEFEYGEGDFSRGSAPPVQDTGADGLKLAPAPLYERLSGCPDAVPILAARDEIVVEREEADAEKVKA